MMTALSSVVLSSSLRNCSTLTRCTQSRQQPPKLRPWSCQAVWAQCTCSSSAGSKLGLLVTLKDGRPDRGPPAAGPSSEPVPLARCLDCAAKGA